MTLVMGCPIYESTRIPQCETEGESFQRQRRAPYQPGSQRASRVQAQEQRPEKFLRAIGPPYPRRRPLSSQRDAR